MKFIREPSITLSEILLEPGLTTEKCIPDNVCLKTALTRYSSYDFEMKPMKMNIPIVSAAMQSVSGVNTAIELAKQGGLSFIYCSQSIDDQVAMIKKIKKNKAGFVTSEQNLKENDTLKIVVELKKASGHSTMPVTDDGTATGKLLGIVTSSDYRADHMDNKVLVKSFMTPIEKLVCGSEEISISEANAMIWNNKINVLPIVTKDNYLKSLVFRKDYERHSDNYNELLDVNKRFIVGAAVNTRDYEERIPKLIDAGADILCIDSSDGYSVWQKKTIEFVREKYGNSVKIGAGNVVNAEAFKYLADAGADFIKVGIGGGSICITREQKGIGCGQATSIIEVAKARDKYYEETGMYIPICSDGGIVLESHITVALALGADFVMMGRYFARFEEAPGQKMVINGNTKKEYWGEGSNRAKNWERYDLGGNNTLKFEEGVDAFVPFAGRLKDNLLLTLYKIKSTMCNCGATDIEDLHEKAVLRTVSSIALTEGSAHDVTQKEQG